MKQTGMIFDMDGILFDTERLYQETWHEIADEMGVTLPEDWVKKISGTTGELMLRTLEKYYHVSDGAVVRIACRQRMHDKLEKDVPVKKGVPEILARMKEEGKKIAIASSSNPEQIRSNLRISGLAGFFDGIVSGEEVEHGKPEPDIFLLAGKKLGCPSSDCVVFEDSMNGVLAGHAAGMSVCMIPDLVQPTEEICKKCTWIYHDFYEVLEDM
ncbi:MAG: HAD family phosphatase [Lachnospiraceae bacterium]|nr:HAD family phosphatase [Lachnospiraceae bacterium]